MKRDSRLPEVTNRRLSSAFLVLRERPGRWALLVMTLVVLFSSGAAAQRSGGLSDRHLREIARDAALADAYHQLYRKMLALPLEGSRTVADLAAGSAAIDIGLRRLATEATPLGRTRTYRSGDAEVDLALSAAKLIDALKRLNAAAGEAASLKPKDLDALAKRLNGRELIATGSGSPPTEEELTGPPGWPGGREAGDLPPAGWANVTPAGFKAAERAAQLDAIENLVDQIGGLKMERSGTGGNLLAASPTIAEGLRQPYRGLGVTKPEWLPEQVCKRFAQVDVTSVVDRIEKLYELAKDKPKIPASDIKSIARLARVRRLRAAGYGVPPSSALRTHPYAVVDVDKPRWADEPLRTDSESVLPELEPATDRIIEFATQDARIAGQIKLAEKIDALDLPGGVTMGEFLRHHEELAPDILTFLSSARVVAGPKVDKAKHTLSLTLKLDLRRLWLIVRRAMRTEETTEPPDRR